MQIQTVFKAGNSNVVAIPGEIAAEIGIKLGQKVLLTPIEDGILVKKVTKKPKKAAIQKEFKKWLAGALKEDAEILEELASR